MNYNFRHRDAIVAKATDKKGAMGMRLDSRWMPLLMAALMVLVTSACTQGATTETGGEVISGQVG
jgi:hypothetical protein